LRAPTRIYERWGDSFIYLDAVYLKCPGGHSVYITTAMLRGRVHKLSRGLFFWNQSTFEERVVAFYEDNHPSLKQVFSHRTIQVGRYEGVELVYLTKDNKERLGAFCTTGKAEEEPLRTKDIVIDAGSSIGLGSGPEILILSYASPPETFDDEVAEFDKMVQTFQLLRQK